VELIIRDWTNWFYLSYEQNPSILNANITKWSFNISAISGTGGCDDKKPLMLVKIQPSPTANFPQSFCISQNAAFVI
jgi:hypothetical protein